MSIPKNPALDIPLRTKRGHDLMHVTPEIAQQWLECNRVNRALTVKRIAELAAMMGRGEWADNGAAIRFAPGQLLDGQHRLHAILQSGATCLMSVEFGLKVESQVTMDTDKCRTPRDVLAIEGLPPWDSGVFGTAVHSIIHYLGGASAPYTKERYTNLQVRDFYLAHVREVDLTMELIRSLPRKAPIMSHARAAVVHFLGASKHREIADMFFTCLYTGEGLTRTQPVFHLRRRLETARVGEPLPPYKVTLFVVNTFNAEVKGSTWSTSNNSAIAGTRSDGRIVIG